MRRNDVTVRQKAALLVMVLWMCVMATGLTGCGMGGSGTDDGGGTGAGSGTADAASAGSGENGGAGGNSGAVRTGLSLLADISSSKDATGSDNGVAQADLMAVGVMVDDDGIIRQCVIDQVKAVMEFDDQGKLVTDLGAEFPTKKELGDSYGMKKASSIGKEWYEQMEAFEDYVEGKTLEQIAGIAVDGDGKAKQEELTASVTMAVGDFIKGVGEAVRDAEYRGAKTGDKLTLRITTNMAQSEHAAGDDEGEAIAHCQAILETRDGDKVTSSDEEDIEAGVEFSRTGVITGRDVD